ncbi:hypothetical protein FI667_g11626, partial [Globisporangium splendens]
MSVLPSERSAAKPTSQDDNAARALDSYAHRLAGASTLELLHRIPHSSEPIPQISDHVSREMVRLAIAEEDHLQQHQKIGKPVQNITTLGERLGRPKERLIPGTPVTRKLHAGRLLRTGGKDMLTSSRSAPTLPHPHRVLHDQLRLDAMSDAKAKEDALDLALQQQAALDDELLHMTKKLNRKYSKQLFPTRSPSPSKIHELATKWSHPDAQTVLSEQERYDMYMEGRFATQTQMDFYERDMEPRDSTNNKHRHNTCHTKYGNALALNKNSLRGKF